MKRKQGRAVYSVYFMVKGSAPRIYNPPAIVVVRFSVEGYGDDLIGSWRAKRVKNKKKANRVVLVGVRR